MVVTVPPIPSVVAVLSEVHVALKFIFKIPLSKGVLQIVRSPKVVLLV
jgi:hypothetical protein